MDRVEALYDVSWQVVRWHLGNWRDPRTAYLNLVQLTAYSHMTNDSVDLYFRLMRIVNLLNGVRQHYSEGNFASEVVTLLEDALLDYQDAINNVPEPEWEKLDWDWDRVKRELEQVATNLPEAFTDIYADFYKRTQKGDDAVRPAMFRFFNLMHDIKLERGFKHSRRRTPRT